ncbi:MULTISPECIES: hypothetical protein [Treponema]|uniref:hypothetical protein n=1 Tax=Treponema TaxID=157 RepID=UPI0002B5E107|nr:MULTISPECIES: hypothetical protein [Treponema]EMB47972.1 hypothetical protein HMPREF9729_00131 [Treponema denticola ASLM]EMD56027.1 hypothetical protein HMPREF9728_01898 [Treponema denticola US-Trep]UTD09657.1 leucine-rich repeat domain-containing protein [Treponema sp. B152]
MTKFKTHKKKGAAAIITAAVLALIALFGMAACSNAAQSGTGTDGSTAPPAAPFVEGDASLILSPDKLVINVRVRTADGTTVTVEGCEETTLTSSGTETVLHAKGTTVILKGNITELDCSWNKLTELNVQGLTALQELFCHFNQLTELNVQDLTALKYLACHGNRLNAEAFTKLFNDLPKQANSDRANCVLYIEKPGFIDDNHTDFTAPPDLAASFNNAKTVKKWKMYMYKVNGIKNWVEL